MPIQGTTLSSERMHGCVAQYTCSCKKSSIQFKHICKNDEKKTCFQCVSSMLKNQHSMYARNHQQPGHQ